MYRHLLIITMALVALRLPALTVNCQPGQLHTRVSNTNATELTVTGQMDARDFRFIADRMRQLKALNLEAVAIVEHQADSPLFANLLHYAANEVPSTALAQLRQLTTFYLPSQATSIGEGALAGCVKLTNVKLPATLTYIGCYAFAHCTALKTLSIPLSLTTIDDGAFAHCTALTRVALAIYPFAAPSSTPQQVPIDYNPGQLTTIGDYAFLGCSSLTQLMVSNNLTHIGTAAFAGSGLKSADLSLMQNLRHIGHWAYSQASLVTASLPAGLNSLGWGAFLLNTSLTGINLASGLSALPPLALSGNTLLTDVNLAQLALDSIGDYALYNLSRVRSVTVPASVIYIGTRAMAGMTGLQNVKSKAENVPDLGQQVWQDVNTQTVTLTVPHGSVAMYSNAEQWQDFIIESGFLLGDANGDGAIDIGDLNALINYMLMRVHGTFIFDAADINQNGTIDISDINLLINMMLGNVMAQPYSRPANCADQLMIEPFSIQVGQEQTIEVKLNNTLDYTALQCNIHLPSGLRLVNGEVRLGRRASSHTVAALVSGQQVRVVVYAMSNIDFAPAGNDDALLQLTVVADDNMADMSSIVIDHIAMVTADGEISYAAPTLTHVSKTVGVVHIDQPDDRVYGAAGNLHIVAHRDGTAQLVSLSGSTRQLTVLQGNNTFYNIDPGYYIVRLNGRSHKIKI